jgi:3-oxoacyl-[acyl-carrier protein] reductase
MSEFTGKVALVTGASRGIGRAVAEELGRAGAWVAVGYTANDEAARTALAAVEAAGGRGALFKFDVADGAACAGAVEKVVAEQGRLDVLVNNAGIAIDGLLVRIKDEDWKRQLDVNLSGLFHLSKAAARPMMKQRGGAVVNLTSVVGEMGNAGQAAYAATKAGIIGFTRAMARELASRNVRVNAVSPGFIDTDMTKEMAEAARAKTLEQIPMGRLGTAAEVAQAVAFLASDRAAYITGQVLRVNGGMLMA